jgi:Na+-transporting NADH:ubiquinone oxidoreductase subunit F
VAGVHEASIAVLPFEVIFELLKGRNSRRRISFYYNAMTLNDCFYLDHFEQLSKEHENFTFNLALDRPQDNWSGPTGFVHQVLHDNYLNATCLS